MTSILGAMEDQELQALDLLPTICLLGMYNTAMKMTTQECQQMMAPDHYTMVLIRTHQTKIQPWDGIWVLTTPRTKEDFRTHMMQFMIKSLGIRFGTRVSVCKKMASGLILGHFSILGIILTMDIQSAGMLTVMVEEIRTVYYNLACYNLTL
jgi:hypothetical protein